MPHRVSPYTLQGRSDVGGLFTRRTVAELLWGYDDALLEAVGAFVPEAKENAHFHFIENCTSLEDAAAFGRNEILTGVDNITNVQVG